MEGALCEARLTRGYSGRAKAGGSTRVGGARAHGAAGAADFVVQDGADEQAEPGYGEEDVYDSWSEETEASEYVSDADEDDE